MYVINYKIQKHNTPHTWGKINAKPERDKYGKLFDAYVCQECGIKGRSYSLTTIEIHRGYPENMIEVCRKNKKTKKSSKYWRELKVSL